MIDDEDVKQLRYAAEQCVEVVAGDFGRELDYSLESLAVADEVIAELLTEGPMPDDHFELWCTLFGAYTGEVVVRAYKGQWARPEPGSPVIEVDGITGMPFATASRVLQGEPAKSLNSFGRALPVIIAQSKNR